MIVLFKPYGNHSNRLFQNLHFEAFCLHHNIEFYNPTFHDMSKLYYEPVSSSKKIKSLCLKFIPVRLLKKFGLFGNVLTFEEEKDENIDTLLKHEKSGVCYVGGWGFRDCGSTTEHHDLFRKKYSLREEYYKDNEIYLNLKKINREETAVVGVHIRRGDYRRYSNGIYYYSDQVYEEIMDKMETEIRSRLNKNVMFIIFSNDTVTFTFHRDAIISKNPWYVDHFLMTACDYLIGPPSTFTLWSSYIGKVPYFHMYKSDIDICLDNFEYSTL